jgi:hypothetical protein
MRQRMSLGILVLFTFAFTLTFAFYTYSMAGYAPPEPEPPPWCDDYSPSHDGQCCEGPGGLKGVWIYVGGHNWTCCCSGLVGPDPNPCNCELLCPIPK